MNNYFFITLVISSIFCCFSCNNNDKQRQDNIINDSVSTSVKEEEEENVFAVDSLQTEYNLNSPLDTFYDDVANYITGNNTLKYFKQLQKDTIWIKHKKEIKNEWQYVKNSKVDVISKWVQNRNYSELTKNSTLFYPFAGADFLYANLFYGNCKDYILLALEPTGLIMPLDTLNDSLRYDYLKQIKKSIYLSNRAGFFKTEDMEKEMNQITLNGTIHVLLYYIKSFGCNIINLSYFKIGEDGKPHYYSKVKNNKTQGVRIVFADTTQKSVKTLYYLSFNLWDENIRKNKQFIKFLDLFPNKVALLKSASYLLHKDYFSVTRNYILNNTKMVLQDDSGIPYKYFDNDNWEVELYGQYSKVIDMFKEWYQPDLDSAYKASGKEPKLPFRIGYNIKHNETPIIIAKRKNKKTA